jgi:hypothetical protein
MSQTLEGKRGVTHMHLHGSIGVEWKHCLSDKTRPNKMREMTYVMNLKLESL